MKRVHVNIEKVLQWMELKSELRNYFNVRDYFHKGSAQS